MMHIGGRALLLAAFLCVPLLSACEAGDDSGSTSSLMPGSDTYTSQGTSTSSSSSGGSSSGWTDDQSYADASAGTTNPYDGDYTSSGGSGESNAEPGTDPFTDPEQPPIDEPEPSAKDTVEPVAECDTDNETVLYLSADDSNSMAGPVVARALITKGQVVYKAIRTYEFLNYYGFDYAPAEPDHVSVTAQMHDNEDGSFNLQIGVQAPFQAPEDRRLVNLVLSIDTSSSMGWGKPGERAIDRVKDACHAIAGALVAGDIISLVTWSDTQQVLLDTHIVSGPGDPTLLAACDGLQVSGTTNFHDGLVKTYDLINGSTGPSRISRVLLFSDGGANVSETDKELIAQKAEDAESEGIYLVGIGVGDPWNYNDALMDELTDAGKGAYLFLDTAAEAQAILGDNLIATVELAARDVQVELTLPPTFSMKSFHGEEYSTEPEEVEPQHLAVNDAMIFHQVVSSCAPDDLDTGALVKVKATYHHPLTYAEQEDSFEAPLATLCAGDQALLTKGDAVVAYAEALKEVRDLKGDAALEILDGAIQIVDDALSTLGPDDDLEEIAGLLGTYRTLFDGTFPTEGQDQTIVSIPVDNDCTGCQGTGTSLEAMSCAVEVCEADVLGGQTYTSPTDAPIDGTYAATSQFGSTANDLAPMQGDSYALMATGPALGTNHSEWLSNTGGTDPYSYETFPIYDAVEWRMTLTAPEDANGFGVSYVFFSEEYDDYVGSSFNDKFYIVIEAGSTNGGEPTVINYTECRDPDQYFDFICSPGMQFCDPGQKYCFVAINTALSECCWLDGCPDGTAQTDISGTGFECAASSSQDSAASGSSTGWTTTYWPIEPGETFDIVFHLHDTSDGIYDSAAIIDQLLFYDKVRPGTQTLMLQ